jgi:D-sedoheptulose 7-phosphate isomerase
MTTNFLEEAANRLIDAISETVPQCKNEVDRGLQILLATIASGNTIYTAGNGGSADSASHFATEMECKYKDPRRPLKGKSLSTDASLITAIGNDFGFDQIFSRRIEAHGEPGDVFIGITTSGTSLDVLNALKAAREKEMRTILLTGSGGAGLVDQVDVCIAVCSTETARIQELHELIMHSWCEAIDAHLLQLQAQ